MVFVFTKTVEHIGHKKMVFAYISNVDGLRRVTYRKDNKIVLTRHFKRFLDAVMDVRLNGMNYLYTYKNEGDIA